MSKIGIIEFTDPHDNEWKLDIMFDTNSKLNSPDTFEIMDRYERRILSRGATIPSAVERAISQIMNDDPIIKDKITVIEPNRKHRVTLTDEDCDILAFAAHFYHERLEMAALDPDSPISACDADGMEFSRIQVDRLYYLASRLDELAC